MQCKEENSSLRHLVSATETAEKPSRVTSLPANEEVVGKWECQSVTACNGRERCILQGHKAGAVETWSLVGHGAHFQSSSAMLETEETSDGSGLGMLALCSSMNREQVVRDKVFHCDRCPYTTTYKVSLTTHARTHTGERPYKCRVCWSSFTQAGNYKRHMRRHTGEKPFKCSMCPYSTIQKCALQRHLRTHIAD